MAHDRAQPSALITMGSDYYLMGSTDHEMLDNLRDFINQKCLALVRFAKEFRGTYFSR